MDKKAFTLIEVMIAVMIISVVIMAMLKMHSNHVFLLNSTKNDSLEIGYLSFLVNNKQYGLENKDKALYDLVDGFDISDDLRRELKDKSITLLYKRLGNIESLDSNSSNGILLKYGVTILQTQTSSHQLLRLQLP